MVRKALKLHQTFSLYIYELAYFLLLFICRRKYFQKLRNKNAPSNALWDSIGPGNWNCSLQAKDLDLLSSRHQWIFGAFNLNSTLQMDSTYCEQEMSQRYYQSLTIPSGQSQVNKKRSTQVNSGQQQLPKSSSLSSSSSSSQPPTTLEMESTEGKHSDEKHVVQPESTGSSGGKSKMTSLSKLLEGSFLVNIHNDREVSYGKV